MRPPAAALKRVRLALNLAVNKREIIEQLFRGIGAAELTVPLPLTLAERNPKLEGYPYDPDKAQKLLKEAGAIGKTITLEASYNRYTLDREMGEALGRILGGGGSEGRLQTPGLGCLFTQGAAWLTSLAHQSLPNGLRRRTLSG